MKRLHWLLGIQSISIILLSINRLSSWTLGYISDNQFLRWVEWNNMFIFPVLSILSFYMIKKELEKDRKQGKLQIFLGVIFLLAVYLLGVSYGIHEVTNYLHSRYCIEGELSRMCSIIVFNDDDFSHWLFFIGFILLNSSLMLIQVLNPIKEKLSKLDLGLLCFNGLFIAVGIFSNLGFEEIGFDLYIVIVLAVMSIFLLFKNKANSQPLIVYYAVAFSIGAIATIVSMIYMGNI